MVVFPSTAFKHCFHCRILLNRIWFQAVFSHICPPLKSIPSYGTFENELVGQIENYNNYIAKLTLKDEKPVEFSEHEVRDHIAKTLTIGSFHKDMNEIFNRQIRNKRYSEEVYHMLLREPLITPDWSYLFGCCIAEIKAQAEPIVSINRKKFDIPSAINRRRDFVKLIKTQTIGKGESQPKEFLMMATQKGYVSIFRGDSSRLSYLFMPDLLVADMAYAEKYTV